MCNLIRYKQELQELAGVFEEFSEVRISPSVRFKVAPSEPAPVVTIQKDRPRISMMEFGFRTARGRQMMARGETAARLPMFREAFRSRRCLILAHGFFDSLDMGAFRQPWHFHLKGDRLMCFAGLWENQPAAGAFTIVSTPANALVARVIDRMPVILPQAAWRPWLDPATPPGQLQAMLTPFPVALMESWPVTRRVNERGFESPACIQPIVPDQSELDLW